MTERRVSMREWRGELDRNARPLPPGSLVGVLHGNSLWEDPIITKARWLCALSPGVLCFIIAYVPMKNDFAPHAFLVLTSTGYLGWTTTPFNFDPPLIELNVDCECPDETGV